MTYICGDATRQFEFGFHFEKGNFVLLNCFPDDPDHLSDHKTVTVGGGEGIQKGRSTGCMIMHALALNLIYY